MRGFTLWRFAALILLIAGLVAVPAVPAFDHGLSLAGEEDRDDDRGSDRGNGPDKDKRDKKGDDRDNDDDRDDRGEAVRPAARYRVEAACTVAGDATRTECAFTGIAPIGGEMVSGLVIPEGAVCAGVLDGDFEAVDPGSGTNLTGYQATGDDGPYTLILDGAVTTGGTSTYWLTAAGEVFPAAGPGLACDESAGGATTKSTSTGPEATPEAATAGAVTVSAYTCTGVPADTSAYDWYGACGPGGEHRYVLAPVEGDDATGLHAAETSKTGEATFGELPPGQYGLEDVNANWCHAESDSVNADGNVVVDAGADTTVWLFYCQDANTS